jgi:acyl carrier protein phosphodiesterase
MNWLAHLLLSEPTSAVRLGGILPDLVATSRLGALPPDFQRGIKRHHQIDAYTDSHALFRRSVRRLHPPYRRFGGILVDIFYDHFLARNWPSFSMQALPDFVAEVYASFESHRQVIPEDVYALLQKMQAGNWLCSYGDIPGVTEVLRRIGRRFRRPCDLTPAISILEHDYQEFQNDFTEFFPELFAFVFPAPPPSEAPA